MAEAVGFSRLYPAVPIMNFVSMTLLLLLIPGFWKTRMVALVSLVFWLALANLMSFICMIEWRGNTNNAPIWADVLAILDRFWTVGFFTSTACFAHFTWQRLHPLAARQLYDTRRRNNMIHFFLALILPLIWAPLCIFSWGGRHVIEDLGPLVLGRMDWPGLVVNQLPQIICLLAIGIFNSLAVFNYWRTKHEDIESDPLKQHYSLRTRKLIIMAHFHILLAVYGVYRQVNIVYLYTPNWVAPTSLAKNIASLQSVLEQTRPSLERDNPESLKLRIVSKILFPLIGFQLFAWFGFEAEMRKAYREALSRFGRLISAAFREHRSHLCPLPFSRWLIAVRKAKPQHGSTDALSLIDINIPQITPYIPTIARGDDPGSHENIPPSNSVANAIDVKRQARERAREPAGRLSSHNPSFAPLNPANAAINITNSVPLRRISYHKPPPPPVNPTASAPEAPGSVPLRVDEASNTGRPEIPSSPSPRALHRWYHKPPFVPLGLPTGPAVTSPDASGSVAPRVEGMDSARRRERFAPHAPHRRISYHKPTFVPLGRPNASAIAPLEASGVTPPRMEGVNNARRHEAFAQQARPRRLSYHKPAFVPLAPANAGAVANELGPTVPLVEVPRDLISDRNARLQAERVLNSGMVPPPFSGPSTTAPPPFSALFVSMAPPSPLSSPSTSTAPPPPFSSPSTSTPTAPPPFSAPFVSMVPPSTLSRPSTSTAPPPPFSSPSISTAPPPFSAVSTSTAPPSLSTPSTMTPAPPYQDVNPLPDHAA